MDQASAVGLGIEATWQASRVGKKAPPGGLRDRRKAWGRQVRLEIAAVARTGIVGPTALGSTDAGLLEDRPLSELLGLAPRPRPVRKSRSD